MHDQFAGKAMKSVALDTQRLQIPGDRQARARHPAFRRETWCRSMPLAEVLENAVCAKRMTDNADGVCSGAKAAADSSCCMTGSSIRQCCRSFGPPCTMRCPIAAGAGILEPSRSFPMRMIASCWLGMDAVSQVSDAPLRILCVKFSARLADRLRCA